MKKLRKISALILAFVLCLGIMSISVSASDASNDEQITLVLQGRIQTRSPDEKGGEVTESWVAMLKDKTEFVSFTVNVKYTYSPLLGYAQIYSTTVSNVKSLNGYSSVAQKYPLYQTEENESCIMAGYRESDGSIKPPVYIIYSVSSGGKVTTSAIGGTISGR